MLSRNPKLSSPIGGSREWRFSLFLLLPLALYLGLLLLLVRANVYSISYEDIGRLIRDEAIQSALRLTLLSCSATAILSVLVAVPVGYLLSRWQFRGRALIDSLVDLPVFLPPMVVGLSLLILMNRVPPAMCLGIIAATFAGVALVAWWSGAGGKVSWGLLLVALVGGALALWARGEVGHLEEWLREAGAPLTFHPLAVVVAQFPVAAAFAVRMMRMTFDQINPRYEVVASSLGCHEGEAFSRVILPMASRGVLAAGTMAWARALGEFGPVLVFAGAMRGRTEVLSTSVFLEIERGNLAGAAGLAVLMILLALVILMAMRLLLGKGGVG